MKWVTAVWGLGRNATESLKCPRIS